MTSRLLSADRGRRGPGRSHTARVVEDLGLAIVSGREVAGSILPGDAELIARYGVSRTVLREALKTLGAKGLVKPKARIGTRVQERSEWNLFDPDVLIWHAASGFRPEFLKSLGEMRMALESEAAALAAVRRTPAQMLKIRHWAHKLGDKGITRDDFVRADLGLHLAVAEAAGNPFFHSIATLIEVALVAMLTVSSPVESRRRLAESVAQHTAIADAIERGDADAARAAMRGVVQTGINNTRIR